MVSATKASKKQSKVRAPKTPPLSPLYTGIVEYKSLEFGRMQRALDSIVRLSKQYNNRDLGHEVVQCVLKTFRGACYTRNIWPKDYAAVTKAAYKAYVELADRIKLDPSLDHRKKPQPAPTVTAGDKHLIKLPAPHLPYGLHYLLRSIGAILNPDPTLIALSNTVRAKENGAVFHSYDQFIHEEGRRIAVILVNMAFEYLVRAKGLPEVTPTTYSIMERRLKLLCAALAPEGYCYKQRRRAASEVRSLIDVWASVSSGTL